MTDERQQITIATRSITDEERAEAELAATEAVEKVRARNASRQCAICGKDVVRVPEGNMAGVPAVEVVLDPDPAIEREQAARAWLVGDDRAFRVGGDIDVLLAHRCPDIPA